jgi:single-stranded-DNA-specific exonuclease
MHRKWFVQRTNPEFVAYLSNASSVSQAFAQVLINRGLRTPEEISSFMSPKIEDLSDPASLKGVSRAVEIIKDARERGIAALVHGDYDADGTASAAIMVSALRKVGIKTSYFIPNRFRHGYGFNADAVDRAMEEGAGLIITVDCGTSSFETVKYAKRQGMAVIITDHHEPSVDKEGLPKVPDADAIINPKLSSPESGLANLSGAGVAFKLAQALLNGSCTEFLDLAALGTLADVVPLTGENRIIMKEGMGLIKEGTRPAIKALKAVSGIADREFRAGLLAFTVLPRINAPGRMDDASVVVELFLSASDEEAMQIASGLDRMNAKRQAVEEEVYNEALNMLGAKGSDSPAIVLYGEGWHEGVIGIVAARLAEKFYRPAFIFSVNGDEAKGSARSIPQFNLHEGLSLLREDLISFGGHRQAAGLKLKTSALGEFEKNISSIVSGRVEDFTPTLTIDADVALREINFGLIGEFKSLEPYGYGNPEPLLGARGLEIVSPKIVGNNHLKMKLRHRSSIVEAIGFDMGEFLEKLDSSLTVDAAFTPFVNEWERGKTLQLNIKAIRPSAC